jgi:hypothetical protein
VVAVLIREADGPSLALRRCRRLWRLSVWLRSAGLDRALAAGVPPDSSVALSLRAHDLLSSSVRQQLAGELRGMIAAAGRPRGCFDPAVPLARSSILACREMIEELAARLEDPEPVDVHGIAQTHVMLRSGGSPMFGRPDDGQLEKALEGAIEGLDPSRCLV